MTSVMIMNNERLMKLRSVAEARPNSSVEIKTKDLLELCDLVITLKYELARVCNIGDINSRLAVRHTESLQSHDMGS